MIDGFDKTLYPVIERENSTDTFISDKVSG